MSDTRAKRSLNSLVANELEFARERAKTNGLPVKETSVQDLWTAWSELFLRRLTAGDPVVDVYLSVGSYNCVLGCQQFISAVDPVARHEEVLEGKVGTCFGATLWTEAYRPPHERVLAENEILFNTACDQWIRFTIKAQETQTKDIMTEPSPENQFVLDSETRSTAYAFLKENPSYNIEDSVAPLSTTIGRTCIDCIKDKDPVTEIVLSSSMYNSFLACTELINSLEPVTRIREMMEGKVGSLYGAMVYTEAYMHPTEQMMGSKEILFHTQSDQWFRVYTKTESNANI